MVKSTSKLKTERDLYMTYKEFKKLKVYLYKKSITYGLLFDIIALGGLRVSEALQLTPKDFDFENNLIYVKTLKRKGHPVIPLKYPANIMQIIRKYINSYKIDDKERVFNFSRQWVWKIMKNVINSIPGLNKRYSPHALRHLHAIIVSEITKGNIISIAKRLRHSDTRYVYRYTHLTDKIQDEIVDGLVKYEKENYS